MSELKNKSDVLNKSLFLFGAGATKEAGCFTSREILNNLLENENFIEFKDSLHFLFSSLEYHTKWRTLKQKEKGQLVTPFVSNIEDLMLLIKRIKNRDIYLPYPITGSWSDKINEYENSWQKNNNLPTQNNLFQSLENKIKSELYSWLAVGKEEFNYLTPLKEFFEEDFNKEINLDIFTLNYDLVLEKFFNNNDVTLLNNGFYNKFFRGHHDEKFAETRINYYKLHGSIDWIRNEDGEIALIDGKDITNNLSKSLIIFGEGNKFLSVDPFLTLSYAFKEKLEERDFYFVIGYSFFDSYINNLLLEGLRKKSDFNKKLIVVNPFLDRELLNYEELEFSPDKKEQLLKNRFIDHIKQIQQNEYLSDIPEFNITEISPSKIHIELQGTGQFLKFLFKENGLEYYKELFNKDVEKIF